MICPLKRFNQQRGIKWRWIKKNYRLYLTKFDESRIPNAMDAEKMANVSFLEPAIPPLKPVSPKGRLNLVLGDLWGLFLDFHTLNLRDYLS